MLFALLFAEISSLLSYLQNAQRDCTARQHFISDGVIGRIGMTVYNDTNGPLHEQEQDGRDLDV